MNTWEDLVIAELKSLNRKLERLDERMTSELDPIKAHVTQVRFAAILLSVIAPLVMAAIAYVI